MFYRKLAILPYYAGRKGVYFAKGNYLNLKAMDFCYELINIIN